MIAIPDFAAGAMENWGLITYRETALLYKEGVSAAVNKQRIATVVSHELAHQWFGTFHHFLNRTYYYPFYFTHFNIINNFHSHNNSNWCYRKFGYSLMVDRSLAQ